MPSDRPAHRFCRRLNAALLACMLVSVLPQAAPGTEVTTSYTNPGGSGERAGSVTVTTDIAHSGPTSILIDGSSTASGYYNYNNPIAGQFLRFDFGNGRVIDEATWYQSGGGYVQGVYKWQGSNDASSWTDIGSAFSLGSSGAQVLTALAGNTAPWRYYQLLGVSGDSSSAAWLFEMEFKIDAGNTSTRVFNASGDFDILGNVLTLGQWQDDFDTAGFALQFNDTEPTELLPLGASSVGFIQARQRASWQWARGTSEPGSIASMMSLDATNKLGLFDPASSSSTPALVLNPDGAGISQFPGNLVANGTANKLPNQTLNGTDGSIILTRSLADSLYAASGGGGTVDLSGYYTKTAADALLLDKADKTQLSGYVTTSSFGTYQTSVTTALGTKADASTAVTASGLTTQLSDFYTKTAADARFFVSDTDRYVLGSGSVASAENALAFGLNSHATAVNASAIGAGSQATGSFAGAFGVNAQATGGNTMAVGVEARATGASSLAMGYGNLASGGGASAVGYGSTASGGGAQTFGNSNSAAGYGATAIGHHNTVGSWASLAIGYYNEVPAEVGSASLAMGYASKALNYNALAIGTTAEASGFGSLALGFNVKTNAYFQAALGTFNKPRDYSVNWTWQALDPAFQIGNGADETHRSNAFEVLKNGDVVTYGGLFDKASEPAISQTRGVNTVALGENLLANTFRNVAFGRYNIGGAATTASATGWLDTDPLLELGNGTETIRRNALTVRKNGETTLQHKDFDPADLAKANVKALEVNGSSTFNGKALVTGNFVGDGAINRLPNQTLNDGDGGIILTRSLADTLYAASDTGGSGTMDLSGYYTKTATDTLLSGYYTKTAADTLLLDKADKTQLSGFVTTSSFDTYQTSVTTALGTKADAATAVTSSALTIQLGGYYTKTAADTLLFDKADKSQIEGLVTSSSFNSYKTSTDASIATKADATAVVTDSELASELDGFYTKIAADARFLRPDVFGVGEGLRPNLFNAVALGRYNVGGVDGSATEWVDTDPLFELGNGTADTARRNALTVRKNGETTVEHKDYDANNPAKENVTALKVNGSAAVNGKLTVAGSTTVQGVLIIAQPAGGIDMGEFTNPGN